MTVTHDSVGDASKWPKGKYFYFDLKFTKLNMDITQNFTRIKKRNTEIVIIESIRLFIEDTFESSERAKEFLKKSISTKKPNLI